MKEGCAKAADPCRAPGQDHPSSQTARGSQARWSSRSLGSRLQHNIFCWLLRCRALGVARGLLAVVVFYYTLLPSVRARCAPYVRRRFGACGWWQHFGHAYALYRNFGCVLLERMRASVTGQLPLVETSALREHLSTVLQRGKGCLVVSAHVGAWQLGLGALGGAQGGSDVPVHILQWRDPGDVDRHYFERGQAKAVDVIDASQPLEAMIAVTTALRQGHVVALMGDRLMDDSTGRQEAAVKVDFLGGRILLPVKVYALASITGAPLVMVFTVRDEQGVRPALGDEVTVPPDLNHRTPHVFAPYAAQFARGLEDFVQHHPYQFFNFYNLWLENHGHTEHRCKPQATHD